MEAVGAYVLRICCCALIVGVLQSIGGNGVGGKIRKLLGGLFMAFVIISPLKEIQLDEILEITADYYLEGQSISAQAQEETDEAISNIIIQRTQAYILDEAKSLDATIDVIAIDLDPDTYEPIRVELSGEISPYDRKLLSDFIELDLGIEKEAQEWDS